MSYANPFITKKSRKNTKLPTDLDRIRSLHAKGYITKEIAKDQNVSTFVILDRLRWLGLKPNLPKKNPLNIPDIIHKYTEENYSIKQIAEHHRVCEGRVRLCLVNNGVEIRKNSERRKPNKKAKNKICSKCKTNVVHPKLHFLCEQCYKSNPTNRRCEI